MASRVANTDTPSTLFGRLGLLAVVHNLLVPERYFNRRSYLLIGLTSFKKAGNSVPENPNDFFDPWEGEVIDSWSTFIKRLNLLHENTDGTTLVWRGVSDASWALHSSLARGLTSGGLTEERQLESEASHLEAARSRWRFENLSALETLAHLQHYGAPTRLIDVSYNPMISLWFAVEQKNNHLDDVDARLFVFHVASSLDAPPHLKAGANLPWAAEDSPLGDAAGDTLVWRPSSYNERIAAQNAAFLLGAVPKTAPGRQYRKSPGDGATGGNWLVDEVQKWTSIPLKMVQNDRRPNARAAHNTFTFRIAAEAKEEIRDRLEASYGYSPHTIYPDMYGLAEHLRV